MCCQNLLPKLLPKLLHATRRFDPEQAGKKMSLIFGALLALMPAQSARF
jgi:hypothetical protein